MKKPEKCDYNQGGKKINQSIETNSKMTGKTGLEETDFKTIINMFKNLKENKHHGAKWGNYNVRNKKLTGWV